jgi:hypothetical protein
MTILYTVAQTKKDPHKGSCSKAMDFSIQTPLLQNFEGKTLKKAYLIDWLPGTSSVRFQANS